MQQKEKNMEIKIEETGQAPVYCKYPGQCLPQPAYIELDLREEPELSAGYNPEIGNGIPVYVWEGRAIRWPIDPHTSRESIESLSKNEDFQQAIMEIIDGIDVEGNVRYIEDILTELDVINVYEAVDYVNDAAVSLTKLEELGFEVLEEIEPDGEYIMVGDLPAALESRLKELLDVTLNR